MVLSSLLIDGNDVWFYTEINVQNPGFSVLPKRPAIQVAAAMHRLKIKVQRCGIDNCHPPNIFILKVSQITNPIGVLYG